MVLSSDGLAVTTLITPAEAFLPNSVLCGPRRTSMRSRFGKSFSAEAERERYTPSIKTPTDGSIPALLAPLPKPRMKKLVLPELCSCPTRNDGTRNCRSLTSSTCDLLRSSACITDTATGISCRVCWRFAAVTTISSRKVLSCANAGIAAVATTRPRVPQRLFLMFISSPSPTPWCGMLNLLPPGVRASGARLATPMLRVALLPLKSRRLTGGIAPPTESGLPNGYRYSSYRSAVSVTIGAFT